jgi:hypothetical protein
MIDSKMKNRGGAAQRRLPKRELTPNLNSAVSLATIPLPLHSSLLTTTSTPLPMDAATFQSVQTRVNHLAAELQDLLETERPSMYAGKISDLVVS